MTASSRIGAKIHVKELIVEGTIVGGQTNVVADDKYNVFRVMVMEGVPTTLAASLVSYLTVGGYVAPQSYPGLIHVYKDVVVDLPSPSRDSTGYMPAMRHVKFRVPIGKDFTYTGVAGATVSGRTLLVTGISDSSAIPHPGFVAGSLTLIYSDA